jgi:PAS domain S-box-containing protein
MEKTDFYHVPTVVKFPNVMKSEINLSSPESFREIFQSASEGILMIDALGVIQLANPVSEKMFGYEPGELSGKTMEILLPERLRAAHPAHRREFEKNPSPRRMGVGRDLIGARKDLTEFPIEVSLSHHRIKDQLVVMAFVIDISERKKAEEALKKSEEQLLVYAAELEKKVKERTDALNKSIIDLEKANEFLQEQIVERKKAEEEARKALEKERELNELKTKFVSIASHEFRTPLSTVLSSISLVSQYKEKGELDKIDKHIKRIKSSVSHLTNILNDLLSLGKLEEGKMDVLKELMNLEEFIHEVMEEFKPVLKDGQHLTFGMQGERRDIKSDPRILRNILFNLISNASKYSAAGKSIHLHTHYWNNHVAIAVKDEGIGIPKADLKHLFDRFFRASNAGQVQGTGLGLNIVKRYIELLGGEINFTSEEGKGSTFTVTLALD